MPTHYWLCRAAPMSGSKASQAPGKLGSTCWCVAQSLCTLLKRSSSSARLGRPILLFALISSLISLQMLLPFTLILISTLDIAIFETCTAAHLSYRLLCSHSFYTHTPLHAGSGPIPWKSLRTLAPSYHAPAAACLCRHRPCMAPSFQTKARQHRTSNAASSRQAIA